MRRPIEIASHTPGPWRTVQEAGARLLTIVARARKVASVETDEDARLIAAAPDLLNACKVVEELIARALPKFDWGASALDAEAIRLLNETPGIVTRAIAKAEGREP